MSKVVFTKNRSYNSNLIIIDGFSGSGKILIAELLKAINDTEITKWELSFDYLPILFSLGSIEKELSGQFQYEKETYLFEFMDDKRTGFVHRFKSSPFTITGETFKPNEILSDASVLYVLEDIILFEDKIVFKRDSSFSRLKPKSEDEVKEDKVKEENRIELLGTKQVNAIITFLDGKKLEIPLGFETLDKITKIELISQ